MHCGCCQCDLFPLESLEILVAQFLWVIVLALPGMVAIILIRL